MEALVPQPSTVEDNLQCPKCNKKYSSKRALIRHLKTVCGPKSRHPCNRCLRVFTCVEYLKYHIYSNLGECKRPEDKSECELSDNSLSKNKKTSCHICFKGFPCEQDLNEHVKTEHGENIDAISSTAVKTEHGENIDAISSTAAKTEHGENIDAISSTESNSIEYKKTNFFCNEEGCSNRNFPSIKKFRAHLIHIHKMEMTKSTHRFSSFKDFNQWKDDLCDKLGVQYLKKRSWQMGYSKTIVYNCKRSGKYIPRGTGKKRIKLQDSCKIGQNCSSSIRLCITEGYYNVEYFEDHYGHTVGTSGMAHASLPESTRNLVIEMLQNKVPRKNIPKMIRENDSMGDRSKLIKYQDVLNIENQYKLKSPNIRIIYEKKNDQHLSDEIDDILKQIKDINKSDQISDRLRKIVKTQLTQTLAMMNTQS